MTVLAICLVVFLAMTGSSSATYCVCNSGLSDSVLQKNIDYACGNGADCTQILQNGPCFNPNTVKDHCNYAVNSYYQRKGQIPGSCDFSGTAAPSPSAPSGQSSTCVYPSSASSGTTPPTTPGSAPGGGATGGGATTPGGAPGGGATGGGTTGGTAGGGMTGGTTGGGTAGGTTGGGTAGGTTGGGTAGGTTGGGTTFSGLAPTGGINNDSGSTRLLQQSSGFLSFILPLLFSGFMWLKVQG